MSPVFATFRILGPLEITVGSRQLELGGTRQQVVLAMLLLSASSPVSTDRLEEAIYGQDPPPTSRSQALMTVSLLRRLLADHGCTAAIARQPQGYVLRVGDGHIDAGRFADLITIARASRDAGHTEQAVAHYRDALRLWRGPALDGVDSLLVQAGAARLDEQRITVIEERLALELDLGRHHELVGELAGLTEQFALRERLREQLMLALYRSGRAAEALQVYQQTRRMMIEELGIEPGAQLQRLQHAVFAADPALDPPVRPSTGLSPPRAPQLLPADIADFTDRPDDFAQIRDCMTASDAKIAVPVLVITGQGGVGKTSLAVHASHLLAGQFQDGQLFADLHGGAARPVRPAQVLERFLLALGVPGPQIPEGLDARAEALTAVRGSEDFAAISAAFKRMKNIGRQASEKGIAIDEAVADVLLTDPAELALYQHSAKLAPLVERLRTEHKYQEALEQIATLRPHVDLFFDKVMVMVDDAAVRQNRLALIAKVLIGFSSIADFSEIVTS